jgi:hypothetical protein
MRLKGKDLTGEFFSVTPHNYHVGIMLEVIGLAGEARTTSIPAAVCEE